MKNDPEPGCRRGCRTLRAASILFAMTATGLAFAADITEVVKGDTAFAIDLYQRQVREKPADNLFFSPYSISAALAMTYAGARGETATEMTNTLHPRFIRRPRTNRPSSRHQAGACPFR